MLALDPIELPLRAHALVEASAGTGKTYTITTLFLRLVLERNADVKNILVVTYTKAATSELKNRLRLHLAQALRALEGKACDDESIARYLSVRAKTASAQSDALKLRAALADFDQAAILTMHGFCDRLLRENAFSTRASFDSEILEDTRPVVRQIAEDFVARELQGQPRVVARYLRKADPRASFLPLLFARTRSSQAHVIPDTAPDALDDAIRIWKTEKEVALQSWLSDRETISDLLLTHPGLNRRSYGVKSVHRWIAQLDSQLADEDTILEGWMAKLSSSAIQEGTKKKSTPPSHPFFEACEGLRAADERLRAQLKAWWIAFQQRFLTHTREELARRGEAGSFVTFDDLLELVDEALSGDSGEALSRSVREAFPFALVDEFQDTDPVQHAILSKIYRDGGSLFMIGDPKQAIYAFRGADVFSYLRATREPELLKRTLTTNWRSDPRLIDAANTVFARNEQPFCLEEILFRHAVPAQPDAASRFQTPFELLWWDDRPPGKPLIPKPDAEHQIPTVIANEIATTLTQGVASPGEIAVLCRTNAQARHVQRALRALGVPTVLDGDASVFDSETAESFEWLLTAVANPGERSAARKALAGSIFGHDLDVLWAIRNEEGESLKWQERFVRWSKLWATAGLPRFIHAFLEETGLEARLMHRSDGERVWTDLHHLVELSHAATAAQHLQPNQLVMWLANMRAGDQQHGMLNWESVQQRVETDEPAVQLTTIHKSKGLEYPIVYCPFLWGRSGLSATDKKAVQFHDSNADDRLTIDLGSDEQSANQSWAEREAFAEGLRLVYVALTRAKHRCVVLWGPIADWWKAPLAHFLHPKSGARDLKPEDMLAELQGLSQASDGTIGVRTAAQTPRALTLDDRSTEPLRCRTRNRSFELAPRLSSFTALAAGSFEAQPIASARQATADAFEPLPAGRRTGSFLHAVLESVDFADAGHATLAQVVDHHLGRFGFAPEYAPAVCEGIDAVLRTPLTPDRNLSLSAIANDRRLIELEFTLPVKQDGHSALRARDVAEAIATEVPDDYAARLATLPFAPFVGHLRGYIDLVFEWEGRWFVADYKSNKLPSYDPDSLIEAMSEHHYFLQYHLYTLAMNRYLSTRIADYQYDSHFGGVFYLFMRGMDGKGSEGGVFFRRPSAKSVEALDSLFGGSDAQ